MKFETAQGLDNEKFRLQKDVEISHLKQDSEALKKQLEWLRTCLFEKKSEHTVPKVND